MTRVPWFFLAASLLGFLAGCGENSDAPTAAAPVSPKEQADFLGLQFEFTDLAGEPLTPETAPDNIIVQMFSGTELLREFTVDFSEGDYSFSIPKSGLPPYVGLLGDLDANGVVDFDDFFLFADVFNTDPASPIWRLDADLVRSGLIDFEDFFLFADNFGATAPAGKRAHLDAGEQERQYQMTLAYARKAYEHAPWVAQAIIFMMHPEQSELRASAGKRAEWGWNGPVRFEFSGSGFVAELIETNQLGTISVPLNLAPRPVAEVAPVVVTAGDTFVVNLGAYVQTDDELMFSFAADSAEFTIRDSALVGQADSAGVFSVAIRAMDTADQSCDFAVSYEVQAKPVVVTRELVVSPADTIVYTGQGFAIRAELVTYEDSVEVSREAVEPDEGSEVTGFAEAGEYTLAFHYQNLEPDSIMVQVAPLPVVVVDRPPSVRLRLERYSSDPSAGRNMEFRIDAVDDIALGPGPARIVARHGEDSVVVELPLMQIDRTSGYNYGTIAIPAATSTSAITWQLVGYMTDSAGQIGSAWLEFSQAGVTPPPPPPPPPPCDDTCHGCGTWTACGRYCGDCPVTPPPPPVIHTAAEARVNGNAPGTLLQLDFGAALNGSAPLSGSWSFAGVTIDGAAASFTAVNGTLTFTAGGETVTWNIKASPPPGLEP